jgi:hypothetical protein
LKKRRKISEQYYSENLKKSKKQQKNPFLYQTNREILIPFLQKKLYNANIMLKGKELVFLGGKAI